MKKATMKITIRNEAHGTETTTTVGDDLRISRRRQLDIRRRLCGMANCSCGGDLSERGSWQHAAIQDEEGDAMIFVADHDGRGGRFEYC